MKQRPRIYYTESQKALMWERWRVSWLGDSQPADHHRERESRASAKGCTSHNGDRKLGGWSGNDASLGRPYIVCMRAPSERRRPQAEVDGTDDRQGSLGPGQSSCIRLGR